MDNTYMYVKEYVWGVLLLSLLHRFVVGNVYGCTLLTVIVLYCTVFLQYVLLQLLIKSLLITAKSR